MVLVAMLPMEMFFDYLAVRVDGRKAESLEARIDWRMSDENSCHRLTLSHGALSHLEGSHGANAQATIMMNRALLARLVASGAQFAAALADGQLVVEGDATVVAGLFGTLENFNPMFNIVEP